MNYNNYINFFISMELFKIFARNLSIPISEEMINVFFIFGLKLLFVCNYILIIMVKILLFVFIK